MLLEDFGVPVPGETILILGAVYAGAGRVNIELVALLGFLGAVIGDNIGFAIGHFGGRRLVDRWGRYILLTPERVDKATGFFERHGGKIIIVARFIEGLRQANGIIAGITGMHWTRFVATRRLWLGALNGHVRAVHSHEVAAELFERIGDRTCASIESRRAVTERIAYAHAAAQHPEWSVDVSFGLIDRHQADARAGSVRPGPVDR